MCALCVLLVFFVKYNQLCTICMSHKSCFVAQILFCSHECSVPLCCAMKHLNTFHTLELCPKPTLCSKLQPGADWKCLAQGASSTQKPMVPRRQGPPPTLPHPCLLPTPFPG